MDLQISGSPKQSGRPSPSPIRRFYNSTSPLVHGVDGRRNQDVRILGINLNIAERETGQRGSSKKLPTDASVGGLQYAHPRVSGTGEKSGGLSCTSIKSVHITGREGDRSHRK